MKNITSADVSAWLSQQAAKVNETHNHVQIRAFICQNREFPAKPMFSIYCSSDIRSEDHQSIEACFEEINVSPESVAQRMRGRAAKLREEADQIEAQAAAL